MKCPMCGEVEVRNSYVIESRERERYIYRRRVCTRCGNRYSTYEGLIADSFDKPTVLKVNRVASYTGAVWIETVDYSGVSTLTVSAIKEVHGDTIKFYDGFIRSKKVYGIQWRAWIGKPSREDMQMKKWKWDRS